MQQTLSFGSRRINRQLKPRSGNRSPMIPERAFSFLKKSVRTVLPKKQKKSKMIRTENCEDFPSYAKCGNGTAPSGVTTRTSFTSTMSMVREDRYLSDASSGYSSADDESDCEVRSCDVCWTRARSSETCNKTSSSPACVCDLLTPLRNTAIRESLSTSRDSVSSACTSSCSISTSSLNASVADVESLSVSGNTCSKASRSAVPVPSSTFGPSALQHHQHHQQQRATRGAATSVVSVTTGSSTRGTTDSQCTVFKAPSTRLTDDNAVHCFAISIWTRLSRTLQNRLDASDIASWLYATEDALSAADWQQETLLNPCTMALVHMLTRKLIQSAQRTGKQHRASRHLANDAPALKSSILACLYVACSYAGQEITYPCWPYLASNTEDFWQQTIRIGLAYSSEMLRLHKDKAEYEDECELMVAYARTNMRRCMHRLPKQNVPDSVAELLLNEISANAKNGGGITV
eukprot:scpid60505/ scgid18320/ Cyclin-dependent kinase 5 activator 1